MYRPIKKQRKKEWIENPHTQKTNKLSSRRTRHNVPVPVATSTNVDQKPFPAPNPGVPTLKAICHRDALLHHQSGRMRDQDRWKNVVRPGRGTGQDDGAGLAGVFDGEIAGTVVAQRGQGVGVGEHVVEHCVAVDGVDPGGVRVGSEASGLDCVSGGVQDG